MLVGVFGDEAVYSGLLEVSNTMCICTNWMGRGLRLGESLFCSVRFREILFVVSSSIYHILAFTGQLHTNHYGNIWDTQGSYGERERETKKQTISEYLFV